MYNCFKDKNKEFPLIKSIIKDTKNNKNKKLIIN